MKLAFVLANLLFKTSCLAGPPPMLVDMFEQSWILTPECDCCGDSFKCDAGGQLTYVNLEYHTLSGTLPPFSLAPLLQTFDVGNNQISGTVPSLSQNPELVWLRLSNNRLTGVLPSTAHNPLETLSIAHNQLEGRLPDLGSNIALNRLFASNNVFNSTSEACPQCNSGAMICQFDANPWVCFDKSFKETSVCTSALDAPACPTPSPTHNPTSPTSPTAPSIPPPTAAPTAAPTTVPSISPSTIPTPPTFSSPTNIPTLVLTSNPTTVAAATGLQGSAFTVVTIFCVLLIFLAVLFSVYAKVRLPNTGEANYVMLLLAPFGVYDLLLDFLVLNSLLASPVRQPLLVGLCATFLALPVSINAWVIVRAVLKEMGRSEEFATWYERSTGGALGIFLIGFTHCDAILLSQCRVGSLNAFSAPWPQETLAKFKLAGLVTNLCEDLPQLILQCVLVWGNSEVYGEQGVPDFMGLSIFLSFLMLSGSILKRCLGYYNFSAQRLRDKHKLLQLDDQQQRAENSSLQSLPHYNPSADTQ